jgi:LacI family transcriptional regulator
MTKITDPKSNIRAIAEAVQLSPTTVSLALRGDERIPEATRQRVIEAASELGYQYRPRRKDAPPAALRHLVFAIHDYHDEVSVLNNPFYGRVFSGAEKACRQHQASLTYLILLHDHPADEVLPPVLTSKPDGVLLVSPYPASMVQRVAEAAGCPLVLVDNTYPGTPYDTVMADDFGGGELITQYLIEQGHRRITFITGATRNLTIPPSLRQRYAGYCAAMRSAGLQASPEIHLPEALGEQYRRATYQPWLNALLHQQPRPTALLCAADYMADRLIQALGDAGAQIPDDISVADIDDLVTASQNQLTSAHIFTSDLGRLGVERLLARLEGEGGPQLGLRVGMQLMVRRSVGIVNNV